MIIMENIKSGAKNGLGTLDIVLFSLMFVLSTAIGVYHAYTDRNEKTDTNFHLGGRKMNPITVSLSLATTYLSALTVLGHQAEIYAFDLTYYWIVAMLIATVSSAHIFIPVFYRLRKNSCYEYIELRYGYASRTIVSVLFLMQTLTLMGFTLYAPSLAFESVTGISLLGTMIGVSAVCILYVTLGGMKTVLWTDSLQLIVMIIGLIAALIEGIKASGGLANAWAIATANTKFEFDGWSLDSETTNNIWTMGIGGSFFWTYLYGVNQAQVQRASSLQTLKQAQLALWLNFPSLLIIMTLTTMIGAVMSGLYSGCTPVVNGSESGDEQMVPLFVLDVLGHIPGLPGIFLACIFSGSLSTISSGLNAMATVIIEDFIKPSAIGRVLKGKKAIVVSKLIVILVGGLQFTLAFLLSTSSDVIVPFCCSLYSILSGPIMGIFVSGMFLPWSNKTGSVVGLSLSVLFMSWLGFGALLDTPKITNLPLATASNDCNYNLSSFGTTSTTDLPILNLKPVATTEVSTLLQDFYRMSYLWYTGLGMVVNVAITLCVSLLTGYTEPSTLDGNLMCSIFDIALPCLPERIRKPMRFGVVYNRDYNQTSVIEPTEDDDESHVVLSDDEEQSSTPV